MKKFFLFLFVFVIGSLAAAYAGRNWIIKTAIDQGVTRLTGFETRVQRVRYDFPSTILVENLKINNPSGFQRKVFADLPEIYISMDLPPLLRGERLHLKEVRLNLKEIDVEKNEKGVSNVSLLSSVGGTAKKQKPAPPPKAAMPFLLDKLVLTLRQVHYEDRSHLLPGGVIPQGLKGAPGKLIPGSLVPDKASNLVRQGVKGVGDVMPTELAQKKVSLDLKIENEVFTNIDRPEAVVNVILMKVLYGKTLGNLKEFGIDPNEMLDTLSVQNTLGSIRSSGQEVVSQATGLVTGTLSGAQSQVGGAAGSAKSQVSGLLSKFKSFVPSGGTESEDQAPSAESAAQ